MRSSMKPQLSNRQQTYLRDIAGIIQANQQYIQLSSANQLFLNEFFRKYVSPTGQKLSIPLSVGITFANIMRAVDPGNDTMEAIIKIGNESLTTNQLNLIQQPAQLSQGVSVQQRQQPEQPKGLFNRLTQAVIGQRLDADQPSIVFTQNKQNSSTQDRARQRSPNSNKFGLRQSSQQPRNPSKTPPRPAPSNNPAPNIARFANSAVPSILNQSLNPEEDLLNDDNAFQIESINNSSIGNQIPAVAIQQQQQQQQQPIPQIPRLPVAPIPLQQAPVAIPQRAPLFQNNQIPRPNINNINNQQNLNNQNNIQIQQQQNNPGMSHGRALKGAINQQNILITQEEQNQMQDAKTFIDTKFNDPGLTAKITQSIRSAATRPRRVKADSTFENYIQYVQGKQPIIAASLRLIPDGIVKQYLNQMAKTIGNSNVVRLIKLPREQRPPVTDVNYKYYRAAVQLARLSRGALQLDYIDANKYTNEYLTKRDTLNRLGRTGDVLKIYKRILNNIKKYGTSDPQQVAAAAIRAVDQGQVASRTSIVNKINASAASWTGMNNESATQFYNYRATGVNQNAMVPEVQ